MESLNKISANLIITVLVAITCFFLLQRSITLEGDDIAVLFFRFLPLIVGLGSIICYFIARAIKKEAGWIVTALGVVFNIFLMISALQGGW